MTMSGAACRKEGARSSACKVDSSSSSSSSGGSQSVHRHIKVLMTGLEERNAHSLVNKGNTASNSHFIHNVQETEQQAGQKTLTIVSSFPLKGKFGKCLLSGLA